MTPQPQNVPLGSEYRAFLDRFFEIAHANCDVADEEMGITSFRENYPEVGALSRDEFFEHIYEHRETVDVVQRLLIVRRPVLLCLVGARGAGKSTVVQKLVRNFREGRTKGAATAMVSLLDLQVEAGADGLDFTSVETIEKTLRNRLSVEYKKELFPLGTNGQYLRTKLWSFLLDADRKEKPTPLFSKIFPFQDQATLMRLRVEQEMTAEEWLGVFQKEENVSNLITRLDEVISFHHLAYAARHVLGIQQQVIWLDNLDRLTETQQVNTMTAVRRLLNPLISMVSIGMSLREENVFREFESWDDGTAPIESRILLEMPRQENHAFFPAADIPVATPDLLRGIVRRRVTFTIQSHNQHITQLEKRIGESQEDSDGLKSQLKQLGTAVSRRTEGNIFRLVDVMLTAMDSELAIFLANNSVRDFLLIFRDCLGDLLKEGYGDKPIPPSDSWYVATVFLTRIRFSQRRYRVAMYDVLRAKEAWFVEEQVGAGCLLPHVVITCVWNLIIANERFLASRHTPLVKEVVERLSIIGFNRTAIVRCMWEMSQHFHGRQSLLEFRNRSSPIADWEQVMDDIPVYLTYRAKCMVGRTTGSFGYLYDCLRMLQNKDTASLETETWDGAGSNQAYDRVDDLEEGGLIRFPLIRSTEEVSELLLPELCDVAQMHVKTLAIVRSHKRFAGSRWPKQYLDWFGVPFTRTYSRRKHQRRVFQLEAILLNLLAYVRNRETSARVAKLLGLFHNAVWADDPVTTPPDFRSEMNCKPRGM